MNNKESGYVYIQTGSTSGRLHTCKKPCFREDWVKIGKSSRPVDVRRKEQVNTTVPLPFEKRTQSFLTLLRPLGYTLLWHCKQKSVQNIPISREKATLFLNLCS